MWPATLLVIAAALLPATALAQVAKVMSLQGVSMLERAGQSPRILGLGDGLEQRDTINVGKESNALLEFRDRTRVTLRPNTIFRINAFSDNERSALDVRLVKGGIRATSGDIAKREPAAVRFQTNNAVLGVRGTEFDARICEEDCGADERYKPPAGVDIAARAIEVNGSVTAFANRLPRDLAAGGAIQQLENIVTGADASAVIAFRDGTRITLEPRSELAILRFHYDERAQSGHVHLKLLAGHAHVHTGRLAKLGGDAFLFETPAGMLRPQGTGFSVGAEDVIVVHTWDGTVILQVGNERVEIKKTDTVAVAVVDGKITFLAEPPAFVTDSKLPRPDGVKVDPSTFGGPGTGVERGLYVWVRDGAVVLDKDSKTLEIPAGGAALATADKLAPLGTVPNFMRFDPTPRPGFTPRAGLQLPVFKAPDGSNVGLCTP